MSVQIEKLEHSMVKLTIEVNAEEFTAAVQEVYDKEKGAISVPGFEKGCVPLDYLIHTYNGIFYDDAANKVVRKAYPKAVAESDLVITSSPKIDVIQMEMGKNFIFTATVAVKPEVTLGQYKGIEVPVIREEVTREEILQELKKQQEINAIEVPVYDRAVIDNDIVDIDYSGSVDGVLFEGGTAQGQTLLIGSHSFIDGFEEQIIGHNIGEEFDIHVIFPEHYHAPELSGKAAVFKIKLNGIKTKKLPAIDDDFAKKVYGSDTVEKMKEAVRNMLKMKKEEKVRTLKENTVVEKVIENAQMDIPEAMIETEAERLYSNFEKNVQYQGIQMEQYFQLTGMTEETLKKEMVPKAKNSIQTRLVLETIAKVENIEVTETDISAEIDRLVQESGLEIDEVKKAIAPQLDALKEEIAAQKAITLITEAAKEI